MLNAPCSMSTKMKSNPAAAINSGTAGDRDSWSMVPNTVFPSRSAERRRFLLTVGLLVSKDAPMVPDLGVD